MSKRSLLAAVIVVGLIALAIALVFAGGNRGGNDASIEALAVQSPLGDVTLGSADAPVTMIEYGSLTCTHCQNFHVTVFDELKTRYIDTGQVRFIFREFPRDPIDAAAFMLARCAPGENGYYGTLDLLFDNQARWAFVSDPRTALEGFATQLGFTPESFEACLTNQTILEGVYWSFDRAVGEFDVNGTPTFFINGERFDGEQTMAQLEAAIEPML
jgi:protein-disulfide isomerase